MLILKFLLCLTLVCSAVAYVVPSLSDIKIDAKKMDAKNNQTILTAQAMAFKPIVVKSLQEAVKKIQTEETPQDLLFDIEDTGELLFQYSGNHLNNPNSEQEPQQGSGKPNNDDSPTLETIGESEASVSSIPFKWKHKFKSGGKEGAKELKGVTHWLLQKVDDIMYDKFNGLIPVSACVDSTDGDGGTVSFSRSLVISSENRIEAVKRLGINVFLTYTTRDASTDSSSFDETITAKIPKGETGQIFVSNPRIISGTFNQRLLRIGDHEEQIDQSIFRTKMIDNDINLEYHVLLGNENQLKCGTNKVPF